MTPPSKIILCALALGLMAGKALAAPDAQGRVPIQRDATYEENLRWEASDDQAITPARVLRYLMGMRGRQVFESKSSTDFVPIVNVYDSRVRVIAAISYKF
jgi:hypothetical protein